MGVAAPFKWLEDCYLSPILDWNLTASMGAQCQGTRCLSGLDRSEGRETACLEDGCEESLLKIRNSITLP